MLGLLEPAVTIDDLVADLQSLARSVGADVADKAGDVVDALIDRRAVARAERDWAAADAIRDGLAALGIVVEDTADGVRWHRH